MCEKGVYIYIYKPRPIVIVFKGTDEVISNESPLTKCLIME